MEWAEELQGQADPILTQEECYPAAFKPICGGDQKTVNIVYAQKINIDIDEIKDIGILYFNQDYDLQWI